MGAPVTFEERQERGRILARERELQRVHIIAITVERQADEIRALALHLTTTSDDSAAYDVKHRLSCYVEILRAAIFQL
jgi:hypothetical protein